MDVQDPTGAEGKLPPFTSQSVEGSKMEILGLIMVGVKRDAGR